MKTKKFQKNIKKSELKKILKRLMMVKKLNIENILKRFESDDDLPMNKNVKLYLLTIIIRSVFREDGKFYPQFFLDDALYDV